MTSILYKELQKKIVSDKRVCVPRIFDLSKKNDKNIVEKLFIDNKISFVIDDFDEQKNELKIVNNPSIIFQKKRKKEKTLKILKNVEQGCWVYFPWKNALVHCLDKGVYRKVRLARNKNLITSDEQKKLLSKKIAVIGLNVGYAGALVCALEGIGKSFELFDLDTLSLSNLNRFPAGLADIGLNKGVLTARHMHEIDPFLHINVYEQGMDYTKVENFFITSKPDIIIEEVDNLKLKLIIRKLAKKYGVPVVMVTGSGQDVILDIERYDKQKNLKILNGLLDKNVQNMIEKEDCAISMKEHIKLARDFMGKKWLHDRLVSSFDDVGAGLSGIPQLGEATFLRGATLAHSVRRIILGEKIPSGRFVISISSFFN